MMQQIRQQQQSIDSNRLHMEMPLTWEEKNNQAKKDKMVEDLLRDTLPKDKQKKK